ncbi:MAG: polyphosphate:AMP phosphotransferase [Ectothiorhodospiraceae bacterium]|nr:polyphosphate:AMP phosphotransferase [Ectothiorhodospiraceae bacterium]
MFEAAEVGRKIPKQAFETRAREVQTALLAAQRALRDSSIPVVVIVSGVEGAGKGSVVNRLNEWLDARGIETNAFWDETDEDRQRPRYWRFWRALPARGTIGIMFGSWYTRPIIDRVFQRVEEAEFDRELARIAEFERMLVNDGALIVKLWYHLPKKVQRKRLEAESKDRRHSPLLKKFSKRYDRFSEVSERAIRTTDSGPCPWHVVEATDDRYRDLTTAEILLEAVTRRLADAAVTAAAEATAPPTPTEPAREPVAPEASLTILDRVDLTRALSSKAYSRELDRLQAKLRGLAWAARARRRHVIAVFEGWDAAGKGGAIRRVTGAMDARLFRVISVAAPTDEERAHHYLWRFWRHVPRAGHVTIYDRSWYGRVLVERVEGFATDHEWRRAYEEINEFEEQLCEHGTVLMKFWLHISPEEQLERFREREVTPWKEHKITPEDWRNRERWGAYELAVNEMVARTSTAFAPWKVVAANDKRWARTEVLRTFCDRLEEAVS